MLHPHNMPLAPQSPGLGDRTWALTTGHHRYPSAKVHKHSLIGVAHAPILEHVCSARQLVRKFGVGPAAGRFHQPARAATLHPGPTGDGADSYARRAG